MNAARASHPSRIKRVVSRRALCRFAVAREATRRRLALREECLSAAVAGLMPAIGCARVSSFLRKNPVKVSFARPAPKCRAHPTPSAVTLEGTAYLDRRAMLSKGFRTFPRFVCKHFAGCAGGAQERFAWVLCESCG